MKKLPKILSISAGAIILLLFLFPLWKVTLIAPQYPDGIGMYIWINKITGDTPSTLQNINILNHYVGMQKIEPDSIPELAYFPFITLGLGLLGFLAGFINKKWLYSIFAGLFLVLSVAGVYDFYRWEYDYGHNLSPHAPIKVPGMAYQPPVLGTKYLLNFKASSYPHAGGVFMGLSVMMSMAAAVLAFRRKPTATGKTKASGKFKPHFAASILMAGLIATSLSSCSTQPQPIAYGEDACHFCKMGIVNPKYGTEIVTQKGKVYKFDSIECMLSFEANNPDIAEQIKLELVSDYFHPGELLPATGAWFLHSEEVPSPMGKYLTASASHQEMDSFQAEKGGTLYAFDELKRHFSEL